MINILSDTPGGATLALSYRVKGQQFFLLCSLCSLCVDFLESASVGFQIKGMGHGQVRACGQVPVHRTVAMEGSGQEGVPKPRQ